MPCLVERMLPRRKRLQRLDDVQHFLRVPRDFHAPPLVRELAVPSVTNVLRSMPRTFLRDMLMQVMPNEPITGATTDGAQRRRGASASN